jgi:23S rRNA (cytidine1920-2'-O)/16S rRNA (cytidine1409-2'-O)-methyltransferase
MTKRVRIDRLLVERGLFESRAKAQQAIAAGLVTADGVTVGKPADEVSSAAVLQAAPAHPWVSRGGVKLAAALERYPIDVEDHVCVDVGASTGGFTEVLLTNGASLVFAIDVGTAQLHPSLRGNPRVISMENTDIRSLEGRRLEKRPDVAVIDASFISLKLILPAVFSFTAAPLQMLALIKPQFEAGRAQVKKGIVRDEALHRAICDDIAAFAAAQGCTDIEVFPSAIEGGDGNREFFLGAKRG